MFTKDSRTETFLTQMGVSFTYTNKLSIGDLKKGWREDNIARPVAMREDAVADYACLMEGGSPAPAPILRDTGKLGHEVLDGVQRIAAVELRGHSMLAAYQVDCDSEDLIASIRVLANVRLQGHAEKPEWTRRRAVEVLIVARGMSVEDVAKMGGWRRGELQAVADAVAWSKHVQSIGGPVMADMTLKVLAKHTTMPFLAREPGTIANFLSTLKATKLSTEACSPFIGAFFAPITKRSKTHALLEARLTDFKCNPEIQVALTGRKSHRLPADVNMLRTLKSALTIITDIAKSGDPLLGCDEYFKLLKDIDKQLREVASRNSK